MHRHKNVTSQQAVGQISDPCSDSPIGARNYMPGLRAARFYGTQAKGRHSPPDYSPKRCPQFGIGALGGPQSGLARVCKEFTMRRWGNPNSDKHCLPNAESQFARVVLQTALHNSEAA